MVGINFYKKFKEPGDSASFAQLCRNHLQAGSYSVQRHGRENLTDCWIFLKFRMDDTSVLALVMHDVRFDSIFHIASVFEPISESYHTESGYKLAGWWKISLYFVYYPNGHFRSIRDIKTVVHNAKVKKIPAESAESSLDCKKLRLRNAQARRRIDLTTAGFTLL